MPTRTFFNLPPAKREKLLRAAIAEFSRKPCGEVSINRIVQAAEIPRGSFYQYFADKTDLFHYVLHLYGSQMTDLAMECLDACGGRLLDLPLTVFDRALERYYASRDSFESLLAIIRQNMGVDVSQFLNFQAARQSLLERMDCSGLCLRTPGELDALFHLLIPFTCRALMAVCCGKRPEEEVRNQLICAVELIRHGVEGKEEPIC